MEDRKDNKMIYNINDDDKFEKRNKKKTELRVLQEIFLPANPHWQSILQH